MLKPLSDLADIHYGKSPNEVRDKYGSVPIVGTGGITGYANQSMFSGPAVVVGRKGTLDNPIYLDKAFWPIDTTYALLPKTGVNTRWLYYSLWNTDLRKLNEATGVPSISRDFLARTDFFTPSETEQKTIATVLDTVDEAIQCTQALLDKQDKIKQGLLEDVISGTVKHVVPSSKEVVPLTRYARVNPSVDIGALSAKEIVSFIPMADVSEKGVWFQKQTAPLEKVIKGFTVFRNKDTIVAKITPCLENGKGAHVDNLVNGIGFGSTEFHVLHPILEQTEPEFISFITQEKSFRLKAEGMMSGSAGQQRVPTVFFSKFMIPVYSKEKQEKIVDLLRSIDQRIEEASKELTKLQNIKSGLMQDLLTGRKRATPSLMRDVEKLAKAA